MQGLLFYDSAGTGAFYTTDGQGGISRTRLHIGWQSAGRPWTHIIPGRFGVSGFTYTDLLFYDSAGTGAFYTTDEQARIHPLRTHTGWQSAGRPWTHIIPGQFGGSGFTYTDLLFYDSAGTGAFFATDGQGGMHLLREHTGWVGADVPWTHIIPGAFGGISTINTGLLFYDSAGTLAFYGTHGQGGIHLLKRHTGWQSAGRPWTHIIPGAFGGSHFTDLLFYDSAGTGAFYTTDGQGGMHLLREHTGWQSSGRPWTHIIPGNFGGNGFTDLLFYDSAGTGAFYTTDGQGGIHPLRTHTGWVGAGIPWTHIIPGHFATESLCVRIIHFKSLLPITTTVNTFIDNQFAAMAQLFATVGINAFRGTTEDLSGNVNLQPLQNLNVGPCLLGQPTQDQNDLFANRNNVGDNEIVIYIVSTLIGGTGNFLGCATHPDGQPGAAVVQDPAQWLTAHEVGHVLDLRHVCQMPNCLPGQSDSLMFPNVGWTNVPPDLSASEESIMRDSNLTNPC
jgi:hypothetical protein